MPVVQSIIGLVSYSAVPLDRRQDDKQDRFEGKWVLKHLRSGLKDNACPSMTVDTMLMWMREQSHSSITTPENSHNTLDLTEAGRTDSSKVKPLLQAGRNAYLDLYLSTSPKRTDAQWILPAASSTFAAVVRCFTASFLLPSKSAAMKRSYAAFDSAELAS